MTIETLPCIVPVAEMGKYCIVSLLLLGLGFGASAHTAGGIDEDPNPLVRVSHTPWQPSHFKWQADRPILHWHFEDGEAGGWDPCVAAAYNEDTKSYDLLPDGNCGELPPDNGNNGNNGNHNSNGNGNGNHNSDNNGNGNHNSNGNGNSNHNDDGNGNGNSGHNWHNGNNDDNGNGNGIGDSGKHGNGRIGGDGGNSGNSGNGGNGGTDGNGGNDKSEGNGGNGGTDGNGGKGGNGGSGNEMQGRSSRGAGFVVGSPTCEIDEDSSIPEVSNYWPTETLLVTQEDDEEDTESDPTSTSDPVAKTSGESTESAPYLTYTMVFPKGVNTLHLPFKPYINFYLSDLFELLGDENVNSIAVIRPTVQVWAVISSSDPLQDEWISQYRGFLIDMGETVEVTFVRDAFGFGYDTIYVKEGRNLIGVPRMSEHLAVVSDFFSVFDCVAWIEVMIDGETQIVYHPALESSERRSTLDGDTAISPTQGYMLMSLDNDSYTVWGEPWGERIEPVASDEGTSEE